MNNVILSPTDALRLIRTHARPFGDGTAILLHTGAKLTPLADGTYLLGGYAADGSDVDTLLDTGAHR